jgi:hypothetical protein
LVTHRFQQTAQDITHIAIVIYHGHDARIVPVHKDYPPQTITPKLVAIEESVDTNHPGLI